MTPINDSARYGIDAACMNAQSCPPDTPLTLPSDTVVICSTNHIAYVAEVEQKLLLFIPLPLHFLSDLLLRIIMSCQLWVHL